MLGGFGTFQLDGNVLQVRRDSFCRLCQQFGKMRFQDWFFVKNGILTFSGSGCIAITLMLPLLMTSRAYFCRKQLMRCNTKEMDARRKAKPMVVRLRPGIAPAQVREQSWSAPFTAERSLMHPFPHQPLRGYHVRGALARHATRQSLICVATLRDGYALRAWRCYSPLAWNDQAAWFAPSPARKAWPSHSCFLQK